MHHINGFIFFYILTCLLFINSKEKKVKLSDKAKILFDRSKRISDEEIKKYFNYTEEPLTWRDKLLSQANSAKRFLQQTPEGGNCENRKDYLIPKYMRFVPALKGIVRKEGENLNFTNFCFQRNYLNLDKITKNSIHISIEVNEAESYGCQDIYLFFTSSISHFKIVSYKGKHKVILRNLDERQIMEIKRNGLKVFAFCDSIGDTISSILKTFGIVTKNPAPPYFEIGRDKETEKNRIDFLLFPYMEKYIDYETIEKENTDFLRIYGHIKTDIRKGYENKVIDVEKYIESGDYIALTEIVSGESCLIQYLIGSAVSHAAIALREPGTNDLYIFEADDRGLFKRKWKEFIEDEIQTMHGIAWFPVRKEFKKNFNVTKAWNWASKRIGLHYGNANMLAANYDSIEDGLPEFMSAYHFPLLVAVLERFDSETAGNYLYHMINVRLKTNYTSLREIGEALAEKNLTIEEVMSWPELDEYVYEDGENWVCSTYVTGILKAGGLFGNYTINAQEFTPKDIYMLNIYEKNFQETGPKECTMADPNLGYCMILGKHRIYAEGFNTIDIYDHMNEKCGSKAPYYLRKKGC